MNRKLVMIFLYLVLATLLHTSQGAVIRETNYRWRIDMVLPDTVITGQEGNFTVEEIIPEIFSSLHTEKLSSDPQIIWQQFGPGMSGYCEIVEYHPTDPNCIMMSPDMYNSYGSWDNGNTWQTIRDCDGDGDDLKRLRDFAFSRSNPDYGIAIDARGSLWETKDRGRSWKENMAFNSRDNSWNKGVYSIVEVDPTDDNIIYICGGDFWNVKANRRTLDSPHSGDYTIWNGIAYGKIWQSTDKGKTWQLKNSSIDSNADIGRLWIHPGNSELLYASTSYGLYRSTNRGDSWENIGEGLPHNMLRDMAIHYDEKSKELTIYVVDQVFWEDDAKGGIRSTGGVFRSTDDGTSWTDLNSGLYLDFRMVSTFVVDYYYRQLAKWFGISESEARSRYPQRPEAVLQVFNRLLIDPANPSILYLGHNLRHDNSIYPGDLWMTEDGGRSWVSTARIGQNWNGVDKAFWSARGNPIDINMQFAHLREEVEEAAYPWTGCRALTVSSRGDVTGVFEQQTLQSLDKGRSWMQIDDIETSPGSGHWVGTGSSNLPGRQTIMDPRMPGRHHLLSGEHGIWKITNNGDKVWPGGAAVEQIEGQINGSGSATSIADIAIHPGDTNTIYALMFRQQHVGQVRKTTDGGATWENITPEGHPIRTPDGTLPNTDWNRRAHQYSLIIDKENPKNIYFCLPSWVLNDVGDHRWYITTQFGVHRSTDGGYNWTRQNNGIPSDIIDDEDYAVNTLCFDPEDSKTLYAAVMRSFHGNNSGGLYVSHDSADTWTKLDIPQEIVSVNHVHVDSLSGKIYIACGLPKGSIESGGVWMSGDRGLTWDKIFYMPLVFKVTTAPYDSTRIAVTVGPGTAVGSLNPGAYVSFDSGGSWKKANRGLGQPDRITDINFDLKDPELLWASLWGSGWYKGWIKNSVVAHAVNIVAQEGEVVVLDGSSSVGDNLKFTWVAPFGVALENPDRAVTGFTAPAVSKDTSLSFFLYVSDGVFTDSMKVNVYLRNREYLLGIQFTNVITGEPLEAVRVTVEGNNYLSDYTGRVYIELQDTGRYVSEVLADHFEEVEVSEIVVKGDTLLSCMLKPMVYNLRISVQEGTTGKLLEDAAVTLAGEELTTDSTGEVSFELEYGEYALKVNKRNFADFSGLVEMDSDKLLVAGMMRLQADVEFMILDGESGVRDARVEIGSESRYTDLAGMAKYNSLAVDSTYHFQVIKEGYKNHAGAFFLESDTLVEVLLKPVGTETYLHKGNVKVYPNPVRDKLFVSGLEGRSEITIIDVLGRTCRGVILYSTEATLDMSMLDTGMYLLTIDQGTGSSFLFKKLL